MTLNYNNANAPLFTNVSRTLSTAIARVSAATFDSDLIPNADNTFSVGQSLNRWKNAFFDKIAISTTTITNLFQIATATPIFTVTNSGNIGNKIAVGTTTITNLFQVATATPILTVTNAGNVGIGNSSPTGLLHVSSNALYVSSTTGFIGIGTTNPTVRLDIPTGNINLPGGDLFFRGVEGTDSIIKIGLDPNDNRWMLLSAYSGTRILLNNNSTVSINDLDDFSIYNIATTNTPLFRIIGAVGSNYAASTSVGFVGIGTAVPMGLLHIAASSSPNALVVASSGNVGVGNSSPTGLLHVSSSALYVSSTSGNVGIGTTAPNAMLHIRSNDIADAKNLLALNTNLGTSLLIIDSSGNLKSLAGQGGPWIYTYVNYSNSQTAYSFYNDPNTGINSTAADSLSFVTGGVNRIQIATSGNIGIGTSTPASALHIVGNYIQISTVSGANPAAADCDAASEAGRMVVRTDGTTSTTLWVCKGTSGWYGL